MKKIVALALVISVSCCGCTFLCDHLGWFCGPVHNNVSMMQETVKETFGADVDGYQCPAYPVNNFGLGTAWDSQQPPQMICDTQNCLGLTTAQLAADPAGLNGYAFAGRGGPINITDKDTSDYALNVVVPQIMQTINVNFDAEAKNSTTVTLNVKSATIRYLNRNKAIPRFMADTSTPPLLKTAFSQGDAIVVTSDVVVDGLSVKITANPSKDANFSASLSGALSGQIGKIIGKGASVKVKIDSAQNNEYDLDVTDPVVVCRMARKQPGGGTLGARAADDWTDWPAFTGTLPPPPDSQNP